MLNMWQSNNNNSEIHFKYSNLQKDAIRWNVIQLDFLWHCCISVGFPNDTDKLQI